MSSLSEETRQKVRQKARNRGEYCLSHQDYVMGRLQIDHIQPIVKGGVDLEDNLCPPANCVTNTNGHKPKVSILKQVNPSLYSIHASNLGQLILPGV